jgi:hypothetical protein
MRSDLQLDELKDGLTDGQFENLLEASFATYIRTNPAAFQYCSTPTVHKFTDLLLMERCITVSRA